MSPHPTVQPIKEFWDRYFQYHHEKYRYTNRTERYFRQVFDEEGFTWSSGIWSQEFDWDSDCVFVAEDEERMAKLSCYKGRKKWRELGGYEKFFKEHPDDILDRFQERDGLYWVDGGRSWDKHKGYEGEHHMEYCIVCQEDDKTGFMITLGEDLLWDTEEECAQQYEFNCLGCYYNRLVATKIIQKAWRKCRWKPEYKMCEKVQLRNLEIETGVKL